MNKLYIFSVQKSPYDVTRFFNVTAASKEAAITAAREIVQDRNIIIELERTQDMTFAPREVVDGKYSCPCCGYFSHTVQFEGDGPYSYAICKICFWEDSDNQEFDVDDVSGPNHTSLRQAQANFREFGACELGCKQHVRPISPTDIRDPNWKPL